MLEPRVSCHEMRKAFRMPPSHGRPVTTSMSRNRTSRRAPLGMRLLTRGLPSSTSEPPATETALPPT